MLVYQRVTPMFLFVSSHLMQFMDIRHHMTHIYIYISIYIHSLFIGSSIPGIHAVIPCYSLLFHVIPCYSMLFHVIPCYSMLFYIPGYFTYLGIL